MQTQPQSPEPSEQERAEEEQRFNQLSRRQQMEVVAKAHAMTVRRAVGQAMEVTHRNMDALATGMMLNERFVARCFEKLGLSLEEQKKISAEIEKEFEAEVQTAQREAERLQQAETEKATAESVRSDKDQPQEDGPVAVPAGATVFGG